MTVYSILAVLFAIGGFGIYKISQKNTAADRKKQWVKFATYLILVFGQMLLLSENQYLWFALLVIGGGSYELISVRKSNLTLFFGLSVFAILAFGYGHFFNAFEVELQQFLFVIVITFDGYSQLSGQLFGRTKLFPQTSPNKTLEGLAGGFLCVIITALVLSQILEIAIVQALVFGLSIGLFATAGDFLASHYKRRSNVKDFSQMVPGHGGVLDRFDSLIAAASGFLALQLVPFSNAEILYFAVYLLVFLLIFLLAEIGYRTFQFKVEWTRKFVHVFSGLTTLTFPLFLSHWESVLGLCLGFIVLLLLSKKFGLLPSINAIDRKSNGSILFPVAVFCSFVFFTQNYDYFCFYLPIIVLAVCDPMAALSGKRWPYGRYKVGNDSKTLVGSGVFLGSCFLILLVSLHFGNVGLTVNQILIYSFQLSVLATITEALSRNGADNLTIPLSVMMALQFFSII